MDDRTNAAAIEPGLLKVSRKPCAARGGIAANVLPMLATDAEPQWQALALGARGRIFRQVAAISTLILAARAIYWLGVVAPLLWFVIVPLAWLHATQYVRRTRWALTR